MEPRAREFLEALSQIPAWSVPGDQIPSQAVRIVVEVQVRVGQCGPCGAITREMHQSRDRQVRHRPVVGKPGSLLFQASPWRCRRGRPPWVGPLACLRPTPVSTKA